MGRELLDAGAEVATLFDVLLMESLEGKRTNWEWLGAVLRSCVEQKLLPVRAGGLAGRDRAGHAGYSHC